MGEGAYGHAWIRELNPTPYHRPSGWIGPDKVLGWIAFGKALPVTFWDFYFYVGASEWLGWDPGLLARRLEEAARGEVLRPSQIGDDLLNHIQGEADEQVGLAAEAAERGGDAKLLKKLGRISSPPGPEHLGPAAGLLAAHIRANLPAFRRKRAAILDASRALRRALARGDIAAYGRPAGESAPADRPPARPRVRVPRTVLVAPVTVACQGVFPWVRSVDHVPLNKAVARLLYRDLAFDSDEVLQVWPNGGPGP
jgi:hypothetical protein